MSSVLKATIEKKTTSVTTHFKEINKEQRVYCLLSIANVKAKDLDFGLKDQGQVQRQTSLPTSMNIKVVTTLLV